MKKGSIISLICSIIFIIITSTTSDGKLWELTRILCLLSTISLCITTIGYILIYKREKGNLPFITTIILAVLIAFVIIFILGTYYAKKQDRYYNEQYKDNLDKTITIPNFNDTASKYNMTPEELQRAIEYGQ